jgi:hypothetical protein
MEAGAAIIADGGLVELATHYNVELLWYMWGSRFMASFVA